TPLPRFLSNLLRSIEVARGFDQGLKMRSRVLTGLFAALGVLFVTQCLAEGGYETDPQERITGGNPRKYLGISRIQRTTVPFIGKYKPGEIVINTKERRLYLVED